MFAKRFLSASLVSLLLAVGFSAPASAEYNASTDSLSGSVQITYANPVTANSPSPALTVEAFGIYLSSDTSQSIQLQIRPAALADYAASWTSNGWVNKGSCPVVGANATLTAADCGISAIFINDVAVDLTKLKFWCQSTTSATAPGATGLDVNTIPGTVIARFTDPANSKFVPALGQNAIVRVEMSAGAWDLASGAALAPNWQVRSTRIDGGGIGFAIQDKRAVIFKANGGTGDSYTQSRYTNQQQALLANRFTRSGFTFTGWNTDPNGNGTAYAAGASYPFAVSETLYAQWSDNSTSSGTTSSGATSSGATSPSPSALSISNSSNSLAKTGANSNQLGFAFLMVLAGAGLIRLQRKLSS